MGWHYPEYDPRVDGIGHEDYRPDPSEFAEEEFERKRKRDYPRGYGPPDTDENGPDPDLESLEESDDPERFLHPDDFTYSPSAEPWDTPIYHVRTRCALPRQGRGAGVHPHSPEDATVTERQPGVHDDCQRVHSGAHDLP